MEVCKLVWINTKLAELIKPYACLPMRVRSLTFTEEQEKGKELSKYDGYTVYSIQLSLPNLHSKPKSDIFQKHWTNGITKAIHRKLYERRKIRAYRRVKASCAHHAGQKIDKELKNFAKGKSTWMQMKWKESKAIIEHLFEKNITLLDSGVTVWNGEKCNKRQTYSGTYIDLIGFDHERRKYVVIEIKCSGKSINSIIQENAKASIDTESGFKKSEMGRHAAQVACSTLLFRHTYPTVICYPLLIICEIGIAKCHAKEINDCFIEKQRFCGWLPGFI